MIDAIAFESIDFKGQYISDGPMVPTVNSNGMTTELVDALLIIRKDLKTPNTDDLNDFYDYMKSVPLFDLDSLIEFSAPVRVQITKNQLKTIQERNF